MEIEIDERYLISLLAETSAIHPDGHYAYRSGRHGSVFIEKDRILANTSVTSKLSYRIAKRFFASGVQVVAGPTMGGAPIAQWVAYYLDPMPYAVYSVDENDKKVFRPVFREIIEGKRVLVVDDVIDTGVSAHKIIEAILALNGSIVGVGTLWNPGEASFEDCPIFGLINTLYKTYEPADCPMCRANQPLVDASTLIRK